jgi:hypothetical protein
MAFDRLCLIDGPEGETTIGLCELQLDQPISPGGSGIGRLSFDAAVSETVRARIRVGSTFELADGLKRFASAEVRGIDL